MGLLEGRATLTSKGNLLLPSCFARWTGQTQNISPWQVKGLEEECVELYFLSLGQLSWEEKWSQGREGS